jgi:hypothetical protein
LYFLTASVAFPLPYPSKRCKFTNSVNDHPISIPGLVCNMQSRAPIASNSLKMQHILVFVSYYSTKYVRLTTLPSCVSRVSRQCGILNISQPYRPPRPVMGTALLYFTLQLWNKTAGFLKITVQHQMDLYNHHTHRK